MYGQIANFNFYMYFILSSPVAKNYNLPLPTWFSQWYQTILLDDKGTSMSNQARFYIAAGGPGGAIAPPPKKNLGLAPNVTRNTV